MRRTRWDQKPEMEESLPSGSQWNNQCPPLDWNHGRSQDIGENRELLSTPRPLDYSSDTRQRAQESHNENSSKTKENLPSVQVKGHPDPLIPGSNSLLPNPWSFASNFPHIYPESSPNPQLAYPPNPPWNQGPQEYYNDRDFHQQHIFDMKWWEEQRQSMEAHLSMGEGHGGKNLHKFEPSRPGHWSFGTRVVKNNERNNSSGYDVNRRYGRYQGTSYERSNKMYREPRHFSHNGTPSINSRYKYESYKLDRRVMERDTQVQHRLWRYNNRDYHETPRPQDYSPQYDWNPQVDNEGFGNGPERKKLSSKFRNVSKTFSKKKSISSIHSNKIKLQKKKQKNSTAETAKKKALAVAANKLKQTFLAAKKNTIKKSSGKKNKNIKKVALSQGEEEPSKGKAEDLSLPKPVPRDGVVVEPAATIKFSASEWETIGEGEEGTTTNFGFSCARSKNTKNGEEEEEDGNSDSDSVQTIDDIESKGSSEKESECSDSPSEEDEPLLKGNNSEQCSSTSTRRRHASETLSGETKNSLEKENNILLRMKRVRSYSTSQVEQLSPLRCSKKLPITSNLKSMLVKQLLTMDKKSLQELVDDPKSRKAQFMMNHFMTMHKAAISQKLNQIRFKAVSSSSSATDDALHSFNSAQLDALPADLLQQVKEILAFEENGKAQQMWEEVSLSLSDLVSGFEGPPLNLGKNSATNIIAEVEQPSKSVNNNHDPADDLDCQIVTPPPKQPATTITIPDSDTEVPLENLPEGKDLIDVSAPLLPSLLDKTPPLEFDQLHISVGSTPPSLIFIKHLDLIQSPSHALSPPIPSCSPPLPLFSPPAPPPIKQFPLPSPPSIKQFPLPSPPSSPIKQSLPPPTSIKQSLPLPPPPPPQPLLSPSLSPPPPIKQSPTPAPLHLPNSPPLGMPSSSLAAHSLCSSRPPSSLGSANSKIIKDIFDIKGKMDVEPELHRSNQENLCDIGLPPPPVKVKQESPSPMMECGLCMHPPRSPHTQQCGFAFGIPSNPVALISGNPRSLGPVPQRPVPHLASSTLPRIFKQETPPTASFLNLEHINRPSSEERPRNPAPPDTANSEPPSPLPIPPPQSTLHRPPPPPRPLIFSPDERFADPPRPLSPPPPQHSPRIKIERQTPQFICCCMRNECERSNSSRQSADFRRNSSTPQGQLCESSHRPTPHVYKYESPYLSNSRSRTPHSSMIGMFSMPQSPRCIMSNNNGSVMHGILSSHSVNVNDSQKVSVGVQTDKSINVENKSKFTPNITLTRSATPISAKLYQTTSTVDLTDSFNNSAEENFIPDIGEDAPISVNSNETKNKRIIQPRPSNDYQEPQLNSVTCSIEGLELPLEASPIQHLLRLANSEKEVLQSMDAIEKKSRELLKERLRLKGMLDYIHHLRSNKLQEMAGNSIEDIGSFSTNRLSTMGFHNQSESQGEVSTNGSVSTFLEATEGMNSRINNIPENHYIVTSSQEFPNLKNERPVSPQETSSNDSTSQNIQRERCTSTSAVEKKKTETLYQNLEHTQPHSSISETDSEEEFEASNKFLPPANSSKYHMVQNCFNRKRMTSGSTSDEDTDRQKEENNNSDIDIKNEDILDSSDLKLGKEENRLSLEKYSASHCGTIKEERDLETSITSNRKSSLSSSPQSPKMRNSSGSEHGYSLRSRGPPSDLFDFNSDSQLSKDTLISSQEDHIETLEVKQIIPNKNLKTTQDDEQADDELEKEDRSELRTSSSSAKLSNESFQKRKRKRKTRKFQFNKCKKKKDMNDIYRKQVVTFQSGSNFQVSKKDSKAKEEEVVFLNIQEEFKDPPPHLAAVLDIKVVGNFIFTASTDGTARLYDSESGFVLSTYRSHTDSVTAVQIIGEPDFKIDSPPFQVITGSEDRSIHVYDGKTGVLTKRRNTTEPVRCITYRWGYLFIGTDGGCGIKWNLKDKRLGEKIQFCGKGITHLLAHTEGGRKVLVVGAKTTPIMIRDAMSGLFLRTLEYVQLTMYSAVFEGNLLYSGGSDKNIFIYDYCSGTVKQRLYAQASISSLILRSNHLVATCYDGYVRIFILPRGELIHALPVKSTHTMFICSALFKNKILLGNKNGEIVSCKIPDLETT